MQFWEKHYKVVLIGSEGSGKNQLFNIFFQVSKLENENSLQNIQSKSKCVDIEGKSINLEILNTPGQSQFQILRQSVYKKSQTLVFIIDITEEESLEFMSWELQLLFGRKLYSQDCTAIMIGINPGEGKQKKVTFQQISSSINLIGQYYEIQLQEKVQIDKIFKYIAEQRLKIDNKDKHAKTMIQRIYENIQNPLLESIKQILQNHNHQQEQQQQSQCAAPSQIVDDMINCQMQLQEQKKLVIKCLLIGDETVGKTSIRMNYVDKIFTQTYTPTLGVDFKPFSKSFADKTYRLIIWDTTGKQSFKIIRQAYYSLTPVTFIVYDVTKQNSFIRAQSFIKEFDKVNKDPVRYRCLVGNKIDLPRVVSTEEGMAVAQQFGTDFMEVSAKNKEGLQILFQRALEYIHKNSNK